MKASKAELIDAIIEGAEAEDVMQYYDSASEYFTEASFSGKSGEKFKACVAAMKKKGGIKDPEALCAAIGRKKYGSAKFQKMAAAGRKQAAKKGKTAKAA